MADRKVSAAASSTPAALVGESWFSRTDAILVAVLLTLVTLAWCTANAKWTAAEWAMPSAYLDPEKCDVVHALAMMKAARRLSVCMM